MAGSPSRTPAPSSACSASCAPTASSLSSRRPRRPLAGGGDRRARADGLRDRRAPGRPGRAPARVPDRRDPRRRARAGAAMLGRRFISGRQALDVEFDMRNALYAHLLRLSFGFYDRHQTGQLMSRATVDLQSVRFFLGYGLIFFSQHVLTIVSRHGRPLLLRVAARADRARDHAAARRRRLPLQPRLAPRPARRPAEARRRRDGRRGERSSASTSSRRSRRRSRSRSGSSARSDERLRRDAAREPAARALRAAAHLPAAARAGRRAARGGRIVVARRALARRLLRLQPLLAMLVMPLRMLGMWIGQAQRATASGERLFEMLDEPEEVADAPGARRAARRARAASASRASPSATTRRGPCSQASTSRSRPGTHGRAGRRTRARARRRSPRSSRASTTRPRAACSSTASTCATSRARSLRREVGVISQDPFLFSATVRENIAFGVPDVPTRSRRGGRARRPGARVHRAAARGYDTVSASAASRSRAASASASRSPARSSSTRAS